MVALMARRIMPSADWHDCAPLVDQGPCLYKAKHIARTAVRCEPLPAREALQRGAHVVHGFLLAAGGKSVDTLWHQLHLLRA